MKKNNVLFIIIVFCNSLLGAINDDLDFYKQMLLTRDLVTEEDVEKILHLLAYSKNNGAYGASGFAAGYHSIKLGENYLQGQRDPAKRLQCVPYDFNDKTVLDIGSNLGGMLFAVADKIKYGVGIDINSRMINVANRLKAYLGYGNKLNFYVFDLVSEDLNIISDFFPCKKVDICFLLSVCMWIKNWRNVIDYAYTVSNALLFESNGSKKGQLIQIDYLRSKYKNVHLIKDKSDDDPIQKNRGLYLCYD